MITNIIGDDALDTQIGDTVSVNFEDNAKGETLSFLTNKGPTAASPTTASLTAAGAVGRIVATITPTGGVAPYTYAITGARIVPVSGAPIDSGPIAIAYKANPIHTAPLTLSPRRSAGKSPVQKRTSVVAPITRANNSMRVRSRSS